METAAAAVTELATEEDSTCSRTEQTVEAAAVAVGWGFANDKYSLQGRNSLRRRCVQLPRCQAHLSQGVGPQVLLLQQAGILCLQLGHLPLCFVGPGLGKVQKRRQMRLEAVRLAGERASGGSRRAGGGCR